MGYVRLRYLDDEITSKIQRLSVCIRVCCAYMCVCVFIYVYVCACLMCVHDCHTCARVLILHPLIKYSGQDPQRLTCKKVPSPSSIREMSTLKLFKWLLMHQKCPQVCISYGKYGPPSPSSKREMSTLKFLTTPAGRPESPLHRLTL